MSVSDGHGAHPHVKHQVGDSARHHDLVSNKTRSVSKLALRHFHHVENTACSLVELECLITDSPLFVIAPAHQVNILIQLSL